MLLFVIKVNGIGRYTYIIIMYEDFNFSLAFVVYIYVNYNI